MEVSGEGAGVLLDVGPFRRGSRLQAHPALPICCLCFVSSDHKHSGSQHACFLSQFLVVSSLLGVSANVINLGYDLI